MAEVLAVGASVIAVIQIAERIIILCKSYIENVHDHPSDLRFILLEASMLKTIFENLKFLKACNSGMSSTLSTLYSKDGAIEGCCQSITELEKLFPSDSIQTIGQNGSKRRKVKATLLALAWPLKANKARKLLDEITGYKTTINLALNTESIRDIKDIKTKASEMHDMLTYSQRQAVYTWLQHTDPSPLHHRAQKNYEPGTGNWILRTSQWANWLHANQRCLWIHGIPGAGKTVLMSYLVEHIKQHCSQSQTGKIACVYYYFYYGHDQDEAGPFLQWLLNQLCRQADLVPSSVYEMYKYGGTPSLVELLQALEGILDSFEITYVIVDAIDESKPRKDLLKVLRDLATDPRFKKLQLLASSREYIDIEKVMEEFSVSVSMANPFVEEDIRLHIHSALQSDPKFRRWPQEILDEVEAAVSKGAEGMFRWAVCQIDALRRLKCERDIVKRALANLPKTLDETYDRIFLTIPDEEHLFVYHAFQWIKYHNDLYDGANIPCSVLLEAVGKSTAAVTANQIECFYDQETLRELCGCLINITPEEYSYGRIETLTVSFAHYTVREYLDSARISEHSTVYTTACKGNLKQDFMKITLFEAHHVKQNKLLEEGTDSIDTSNAIHAANDFNAYCVVSALLSITKWPSEISQHNVLCTLAIDLLDPSKPNFQLLSATARHFSNEFPEYDFEFDAPFWQIEWNSDPGDNDAVHFLNISIISIHSCKYWESECLALARKFLQGKDSYNFLQTRLNFSARFWNMLSSQDGGGGIDIYFDGSIIEFFAQKASQNQMTFKLLLEYGTGLFDPSRILLFFIGHHDHGFFDCCDEYCMVKRLLKLGADPNETEYRVTPLQIAVISGDSEGVGLLMKAGADPNDSGNTNGIIWRDKTPMHQFSYLHGYSPLHICRFFDFNGDDWPPEKDIPIRQNIEAILLQYGAEAILSSPEYDS